MFLLITLMFSLLFMAYDLLTMFTFFIVLTLSFSYLYMGFFDGVMMADYLSLALMFVSLWVFCTSILSMGMSLFPIFLFWMMLNFIFISFFITNFFFFYVSFELVFIIMFFYLMSMGNSFERLQASMYMFFYTLIFSLPFLFFITELMSNISDFFLFIGYSYPFHFFWFLMYVIFMVKLPVYSFHSWLIKAHVEAPVSGSMLLAGVMLKLGGYGIMRFMHLLKFTTFLYFFISFIFCLSLFGMVLISMFCFRQMDLKMIIAYSSVVHMGLMLLGILSVSTTGFYGSVLMMISHGFISPLMFFLMNKPYNKYSSRSIMLLSGGLLMNSIMSLLWFASCALNLGVPPFMSFFSEIMITMSLSCITPLEWGMMLLACFFTGVYCIMAYTTLCHGKYPYLVPMKLPLLDLLVSSALLFFVVAYPYSFLLNP